jgi:hypothetical protein
MPIKYFMMIATLQLLERTDYALVTDFNTSNDVIQLRGTSGKLCSSSNRQEVTSGYSDLPEQA